MSFQMNELCYDLCEIDFTNNYAHTRSKMLKKNQFTQKSQKYAKKPNLNFEAKGNKKKPNFQNLA